MAATVPMKFMIEETLAKAIRIAAAEHGGRGQISVIANRALADYLRKESDDAQQPQTRKPTTTPGTRSEGVE